MSYDHQVAAASDLRDRTPRRGLLAIPVVIVACLIGLAGQGLLDETYSRVQQRGVPVSADNPVYIMVALVSSLAVLWICAIVLKRDKLVIRLVLLSFQLATAIVSLLIFRMSVHERNPVRGSSAIAILIAVGVIASVFIVGPVATIVSLLRRRAKRLDGWGGSVPSGPRPEC